MENNFTDPGGGGRLQIGIPPKTESRLKSMLTKPKKRAPIITIYGGPGVGKTTLLSLFKNPVLIRTEDGSQAISESKVYQFEIAYTFDNIIEQLQVLLDEDHKFKTLAIDSITKNQLIFEKEVLSGDPRAKSLNTAFGGYGVGTSMCVKKHAEIRELCSALNRHKNMTILFIAHSDTDAVDLPDMPSFKRHTIRLPDKALPYFVDDVDVVALCRLQSFISKDEDDKKNIATSTENRVISCYSSINSISKNRYGITNDIAFTKEHIIKGINPLAMLEAEE